MANKLKRSKIQEKALEKELNIAAALDSAKKERAQFSKNVFGEIKSGSIYEKILLFFKKNGSRILEEKHYISAIQSLVKTCDFFIRDLDNLKLRGKSPKTHFHQLVNHLLVKYKMPMFWYNVWDKQEDRWIYWFVDVAQGSSVVKTSPIPLTKKQAHLFMQVPSEFHPSEALRIAQYLDCGGDTIGARSLIECRQMEIPTATFLFNKEALLNREKFNLELMGWLSKQTMLEKTKFADIVDWAHDVKFIWSLRDVAEFVQPNLTMKGRTYDSVSKAIERWHIELNKIRPAKKVNDKTYWNGMVLKDWSFMEMVGGKEVYWTTNQITTWKELKAEGAAMHHCVSSYLEACLRGETYIFSMKRDGQRALTLEVRGNTIYQKAGLLNRRPTDKENLILARFCSENGLLNRRSCW